MIPKSKFFDILICVLLLSYNSYNHEPNKILNGNVVNINYDGEISVKTKHGIKDYLLYGLDYNKANIIEYKRFLDPLLIGSKVTIVEINKKAILFWYSFNINKQMVQDGFIKIKDCDLDMCDGWVKTDSIKKDFYGSF